ncbi:MAG: hypothetical protein ACLR13_01270 [Acutalibacteraceae bacterium]
MDGRTDSVRLKLQLPTSSYGKISYLQIHICILIVDVGTILQVLKSKCKWKLESAKLTDAQ